MYLSQLAVYNKIKNTLAVSEDINEYINKNRVLKYPNGCIRCLITSCCSSLYAYEQREFKQERNGPAMTIIVKRVFEERELFHADFTFGLFCKTIPNDYMGMFYFVNICYIFATMCCVLVNMLYSR